MASERERSRLDLDVDRTCWGGLAALPVDRGAATARLTTCFRLGESPGVLHGRMVGYFLTTTIGAGVDPLLAPLARLWMPWKGKIFDTSGATGWNWFSDSARPLLRLVFPRSARLQDDRPGTFRAYRFRTVQGMSELLPDVSVLRIDYGLPENPRWPFRGLTDEVVLIGRDLYLGQALLRGTEGLRRVAWFALESDESNR